MPEFQGNQVNASSVDLDEDLLFTAENRIIQVGGASVEKTTVILNPNQKRKYLELVLSAKRFSGLSLDAGYENVTWGGRPVLETVNCPETDLYIGDMSKLQKASAPGQGVLHLDSDFGPVLRWAPGYDAGLAYFKAYFDWVVRKPNAWCNIKSLNNVTVR